MHRDLPRRLGLLDAVSIVVGIVVGGGIFLAPNLVARSLGSAPLILAVWIFAGVVSFFGALGCAELGAAFPATGGQYAFLRDAYGPLAGFLCGWTMFTVYRSAQIAWLAVSFSIYTGYLIPLSPLAAKAFAVAAIAFFCSVNYLGATAGAGAQKIFTAAKIVGILLIVGSAFFMAGRAPAAPTAQSAFSASSFGVALIACLLAFDGWAQLSDVAGEIRDPQRNIFRGLAIGSAICIAVYLLANLAYLRVLSIPEIAGSDYVGATAAERALGPAGGKLVSAIVLISILGALNGCFLTTPRICFAQAADGLFFGRFAQAHPRYRTPSFAIAAQGVWTALLVATGSYASLVNYAMFATWLFYGAMMGAVIVMRRRRPDAPRPYRMWGYPATALVFLAITAWFLGNMLINEPWPSLTSLGLIAAGLPAYVVWKTRHPAARAAQSRS
jgi:APA family basic amino acid/polyamine antiporter